MAVKWTAEQQKVIDTRDRNVLVSAAAGSGKTAVLVERILAMVKDPVHPIDIDQLLVVTFTRAAAGEMKERIGRALQQSLAENPANSGTAEANPGRCGTRTPAGCRKCPTRCRPYQ